LLFLLSISCSANNRTLSFRDIELTSGLPNTEDFIFIWHPETAETGVKLEGHTDAVMHVLELPGEHLLSVSNDGSARIWDINTSKLVKVIQPDKNEKGTFAIGRCTRLECGAFLLTGLNRMIFIYDHAWHPKGKIKMRSDIQTLTPYSDTQFLVGQKDGNLVMFDIEESLFKH
jgi:WD40 repeat protein